MYTDSLGNRYERLPTRRPIHKAKATTQTSVRRSGKHRTSGVTHPSSPYARYRARVGKPAGPHAPGAKAGKNRIS